MLCVDVATNLWLSRKRSGLGRVLTGRNRPLEIHVARLPGGKSEAGIGAEIGTRARKIRQMRGLSQGKLQLRAGDEP